MSTQQYTVGVFLNLDLIKILTLLHPLPHSSLRFSLKTRWMTKSDQRTVFTDSLYLYVCGLASPNCTPALVQLASTSGGTGSQSWIQKRQALILKLLKKLCHSNTLTGPKVIRTEVYISNNLTGLVFWTDFQCTTFISIFLLIHASFFYSDIGALPLCPGEPRPPTGQADCGYKNQPGVAQHSVITY